MMKGTIPIIPELELDQTTRNSISLDRQEKIFEISQFDWLRNPDFCDLFNCIGRE